MRWRNEALCAETSPDVFFPEQGESVRSAKRVCAACSVIEECLKYALEHRISHGVWGGLSPKERKQFEEARNQLRKGRTGL